MSTTMASRLPSRLPKSGKTVNGISTGQQQKTLTTSSKLQKISVKTKLKSPLTGINKNPTNKSPDNNSTSTTTQLPSPQSNTTNNAPKAAITKTMTKLRSPIKTNNDATNKSSLVRSMIPSPKSSISSSSITNDHKSTAKKNLAAQTSKQTPISKRKNEDTPSRNIRAAPSPNTKKSSVPTPKSITTKNILSKKATSVQEQSRSSTKRSLNSTVPTRRNDANSKLIAKIETLQAENKKLQAENRELMHEKGLLTVDVCQMEHRLACEESRVLELEVDVADLRSLLNGKHNLDRNNDHCRNELNIANNLIMEQAVTMSDQQALIEELMAQLDEQENICQNLQNVIENFKTKHNILDDFKDINFVWQIC